MTLFGNKMNTYIYFNAILGMQNFAVSTFYHLYEVSCGPDKGLFLVASKYIIYLEEVYLVTALVPSETACLASSPGRRSLTAV